MRILLLLLISVFCAQATAQSFSLEQAKTYALEHHFLAKNAKHEERLAELTVAETRAMGLPSINGSANFQNFIDIPTSVAPAGAFGFPDYITDYLLASSQQSGIPINFPDPSTQPEFTELQFGTKYNTSAQITANQLLFDGVYFYGLKAAKAYTEMTLLQTQQTNEELLRNVEKAYYLALISKENITTLTQSVEVLENTHKQTKALFEQGFIEKQALDQLALSLLQVKNRLEVAKNQEKLSLAALKFQMGYEQESAIELTDNISKVEQAKIPGNSFDATDHVDYQIDEYRTTLLGLQKKVDRANSFPKLYGFFNHSQNAFSNDFGYSGVSWYPTTLWGLQLQVPIFSGGSLISAMKKSDVEITRANEMKAFTKDRLALEFSSAKTNYTAALLELQNAKKGLELAKEIEQINTVKFKEGMISSLELTTAQNQVMGAQGNYIASLMNLANTKVELSKFNP